MKTECALLTHFLTFEIWSVFWLTSLTSHNSPSEPKCRKLQYFWVFGMCQNAGRQVSQLPCLCLLLYLNHWKTDVLSYEELKIGRTYYTFQTETTQQTSEADYSPTHPSSFFRADEHSIACLPTILVACSVA